MWVAQSRMDALSRLRVLVAPHIIYALMDTVSIRYELEIQSVGLNTKKFWFGGGGGEYD